MRPLRSDKKLYISIFTIAIPIIIQNIVQHFQLLVDRAFLGNLDVILLSAIGNVQTPFNAILSFLFAASTGVTVIIAQKIGAKKYKQAQRYAEVSFIFASIFAVIIALLWIIFPRQILSVIGAKGEILEYGIRYVRIIAVSVIFTGLDMTAASILQASGITRPIMFSGIIKNIVNIFLDWVLIFGHFGIPAMGIEGAAWATVISNLTGTAIIFIVTLRNKKMPFIITFLGILTPKWNLYRDVLKIGLPSGLEFLLWQTGQLIIVRILNFIDPMSIGIYTLVNGIYIIAIFIYQGFARSAITLVGQAWGRNDIKESKHIGMVCQKLSLYVCLFIASILMIFPKTLLGIFTQNTEVLLRAIPLLRIASINIFFQCINVVSGNCIRATGDTKWMLYSQIFGTIFVISFSNLAIFGLNAGLIGLFITIGLDESIRSIINFFRFTSGVNPLLKLHKKKENL